MLPLGLEPGRHVHQVTVTHRHQPRIPARPAHPERPRHAQRQDRLRRERRIRVLAAASAVPVRLERRDAERHARPHGQRGKEHRAPLLQFPRPRLPAFLEQVTGGPVLTRGVPEAPAQVIQQPRQEIPGPAGEDLQVRQLSYPAYSSHSMPVVYDADAGAPGNFSAANAVAVPTIIHRASGTGRYKMPFTMLKPSCHHWPVTVPSIVAVIPDADVPPTALDACIDFCAGNGVWLVTVDAVEFWFSWIRVWFVVVTESWLHQQRVNSTADAAGARTWLTVIAVDVAT